MDDLQEEISKFDRFSVVQQSVGLDAVDRNPARDPIGAWFLYILGVFGVHRDGDAIVCFKGRDVGDVIPMGMGEEDVFHLQVMLFDVGDDGIAAAACGVDDGGATRRGAGDDICVGFQGTGRKYLDDHRILTNYCTGEDSNL